MYYHVDGDLVPDSEATVSVRDRGFRYGDAAFETLRAYGGTIFEWEAHRERLGNTCETLGMPDAVPDDLADRIGETLTANDLEDAYVRASVTRGEQPGKLTPRPEVDPTVVIEVKPLPRAGVDGESVWDGPATLRTVETRRIPDEALPATAKTHNYLDGILARLELRRENADEATAGRADADGADAADETADEALVRDLDGYVTEGATSNVFFVADGTLHTPSLDAAILPGVTRSVVLDLAERAEIPVETGRYRVEDVRAAAEVFLTNTTWEIRPVAAFDGQDFEVGPVTEQLMDSFDRRVERCY